jgi:hypothetical protein
MNILKRLQELSADELHRLQRAVVGEVHRRKRHLSRPMNGASDGSVGDGLSNVESAPVFELSPDAQRPDQKRRAA